MGTEQSCTSCGFLARKPYSRVQATAFFEMPEETRRSGGGWWALQVAGMGTKTVPACCVGAFPILDEILAIHPDALGEWPKSGNKEFLRIRREDNTPERNAAAKKVFEKPRPECADWFRHIVGLSPERHLELRNMQNLELDRRAFEERLDNSNKQFLAGLEHERREWEKDAGKWPKRLIWAAIILAVAEVVSNVPVIQRLLHLD